MKKNLKKIYLCFVLKFFFEKCLFFVFLIIMMYIHTTRKNKNGQNVNVFGQNVNANGQNVNANGQNVN